jgi:predicted nucleotidyltransferase
MRLAAPRRFLSSVVVKSADRAAVESAVLRHCEVLRSEHPEIRRIIWFGSWVGGIPTPGSDVDLCIILSESNRSFRDRLPLYLPGAFPVGIDLFPYTEAEFARLAEERPSWYSEIAKGRDT